MHETWELPSAVSITASEGPLSWTQQLSGPSEAAVEGEGEH